MNEQNFDNQLRESLGNYPSKLDTGALWKQLEPQLAADKKRRRGIFWWWSGAGLLLLALAIWGWYTVQTPKFYSTAPEKAIGNQAGQSPETTASEAATGLATGAEKPDAPPAVTAPEVIQSAGTETPSQSPALENAKQAAVSKLPKSTSNPSGKRKLPKKALSQNGGTAFPSIPAETNAAIPAVSFDLKATKPVVISTNTQGMQNTEPAPIAGTNLSVPQLAAPENRPISEPLSPLAYLEIKSLVLQDKRFPLLPVTLAKPRKKAAKTDLLIRPNFEIGYAFNNLGGSLPDSASYHLRARRESEDALEYLHGSLLVGARHHTGWYALTGLGYTSITERFSYNTARTEQDSVTGITEIYINAQGDSIFTEGFVERTRHITYRKRTYSTYTLLDVPLIVGYDQEKGRWSYGVEAGVFLNISLKAKGDVLIESLDFNRLEDTNWFKSSIGLSYYGSLRVGYALDDKTRISMGPTFRYVPDISDPDTNDFKQGYGLLGLNLGIARRF